jgi:hypothetical protein
MGLKRNRTGTSDSPAESLAPTVPIGRLRPVHDLLLVDLHHDRVAVHDDCLSEPLLVFDEGLIEIDDMVETAGSRAAGAVVNLHLETFRRESAGRRLTQHESTFEGGLRFFAICFGITFVLKLPLQTRNTFYELVTDAPFISAQVLLFGFAVYFAWRIVGAKASIDRLFTIHFYLAGVLKMFESSAYLMIRGILRSDPALSKELISTASNGNILSMLSVVERSLKNPVWQLVVIVQGIGLGGMLVWILIGWGAYRQLTGSSKSRSLVAFLLFCVLCLAAYIAMALFAAALVSP